MEDKKKNEVINAKELEQVAGGGRGERWYKDEQGNWVVDRYEINVVHNGDPEDRFKNGDYMLLP